MIKLICGDAGEVQPQTSDLIFTDPPFDMDAKALHDRLMRHQFQHLVMICTMRQILDFHKITDLHFCFDFVLDCVQPRTMKSTKNPHRTHVTGVYYRRPNVKSAFDVKNRQRSDVFSHAFYWPSIIRAPRERAEEHTLAKNTKAVTDIIGSFDVQSVLDPFAGSGTTGLACLELDIPCTLIERDAALVEQMRQTFRFFGVTAK